MIFICLVSIFSLKNSTSCMQKGTELGASCVTLLIAGLFNCCLHSDRQSYLWCRIVLCMFQIHCSSTKKIAHHPFSLKLSSFLFVFELCKWGFLDISFNSAFVLLAPRIIFPKVMHETVLQNILYFGQYIL